MSKQIYIAFAAFAISSMYSSGFMQTGYKNPFLQSLSIEQSHVKIAYSSESQNKKIPGSMSSHKINTVNKLQEMSNFRTMAGRLR